MGPCYMSSNLVHHLIHSSKQCYESGTLINPIFPTREPRPESSSNLAKVPELHGMNQGPADTTARALTSPPCHTASLNILLWFFFVYMSIFHIRLYILWVRIGFSHLFNHTPHCRCPTNVECWLFLTKKTCFVLTDLSPSPVFSHIHFAYWKAVVSPSDIFDVHCSELFP